MSDKEYQLDLRAEKAIRSYLLKLFAIPSVIIAVLGFFLGYFIKDVAYQKADIEAQRKIQDIETKALEFVRKATFEIYTDLNNVNKTLIETELKSKDALTESSKALKTTKDILKEAKVQEAALASLQALSKSKEFIKTLATNPVFVEGVSQQLNESKSKIINNDSGSCVINDSLQICWGSRKLTGSNHTREITFTFASSFGDPPVVTNGINADGTGYLFSVFKHSVTTSNYSVDIAENHSYRPSTTPVTMNYIAIGSPG